MGSIGWPLFGESENCGLYVFLAFTVPLLDNFNKLSFISCFKEAFMGRDHFSDALPGIIN